MRHLYCPSTCASVASAWGSQKTMSMARYSAMAVDSSVRACSCWLGCGIQRAEAPMAVGHERAHAEFVGQGEGLLVVGYGQIALRRIAPCGDLAEEPQRIRLVAQLLVRTGECQRPLGEGVRLLQATGQQMRFSQRETTQRLKACHVRSLVCSIAGVSSATASATRPDRVYAAPRAAATLGTKSGRSAS